MVRGPLVTSVPGPVAQSQTRPFASCAVRLRTCRRPLGRLLQVGVRCARLSVSHRAWQGLCRKSSQRLFRHQAFSAAQRFPARQVKAASSVAPRLRISYLGVLKSGLEWPVLTALRTLRSIQLRRRTGILSPPPSRVVELVYILAVPSVNASVYLCLVG